MDDLEFVRRCVKGDKQSWDEFVARYSRLIYTYIHSVLKIKGQAFFNQQDINDLFQEIFYSLFKDNFKKLKSFQARNGCSLASWLRIITINSTIDYLRKFKPLISLDQDNQDELNLKDILADGGIPVREKFSLEERIGELKDCIQGLDREDKYFLELYLKQNFSPEEMAGALGISRPATDMRKSRIMEKLRDCFKAKGFRLDL